MPNPGPTNVMPRPVTETGLRDVELKLLRLIRELTDRVEAVERRSLAMHLGSTCHPEWVTPNPGPGARARRAGIVESVLASAGPAGMTLPELAAYLHLPLTRRDTLTADIDYLVEEDRAQLVPRRSGKWRIKGHHAP